MVVLLAPLLLLTALRYFYVPTDPDYWWHVRTGQLILETGALPRADDFSYTVAGQPWVTHEWLTEVIWYLVQSRFGYVGNVLLFAALGTTTCLLVYTTCRARGIGEPAAAILMLWAWGMAMPSANVRAQLLTVALSALLVLLITRYKQGQSRAIWLIPPVFALWVNLHGGYLIGLVLLGLTCLGEALARALGRDAAPLRPLLAATVASMGATLLNPHGLEALLYPFTYAGTGNASMRYIMEWQSPDFHKPHFLLLAASLLLAIALGIGRRPLGPTEVLWTVGLALMALQSGRHIPLYAVVVTPLLAARLAAEAPLLARPLATWRRPRLLAVSWLLLAAAIPKIVLAADGLGSTQLGREPNSATYPAAAVEYLRSTRLEGNLYNSYYFGGYLVYELYPSRRVFIDGRADVYGDTFMDRYIRVSTLQPGWRQVLDEHDVRLVLVEKNSRLAAVLRGDPQWTETLVGEAERLFVRQ
jgi:hypothetical protein